MVICAAFSQSHDQVANVLTYALLELKELSRKEGKSLFYQISDKPTLKSILLIKHLSMMEKCKYNSCYVQVFVKNSIAKVVDQQSS